jgi:hypothetical protein
MLVILLQIHICIVLHTVDVYGVEFIRWLPEIRIQQINN